MDSKTVEIELSRFTAIVMTPTLVKQCIGFMIGSAFFAVGAVPAFSDAVGSLVANIMFFVGAWFFTYSGLVQWSLSGDRAVQVRGNPVFRAAWLAAATQSVGTVLFNISTTSALEAANVADEKHFVWSPDAAGSVFFLISGVFVIIAYTHERKFFEPSSADWWSSRINWWGCVAFGVSAVGGYITTGGQDVSDALSSWGTVVGGVCFFLASAVVLPAAIRNKQ